MFGVPARSRHLTRQFQQSAQLPNTLYFVRLCPSISLRDWRRTLEWEMEHHRRRGHIYLQQFNPSREHFEVVLGPGQVVLGPGQDLFGPMGLACHAAAEHAEDAIAAVLVFSLLSLLSIQTCLFGQWRK